MPDDLHTSRPILICEQGFLRPRKGKPVHGIELFRLHLIRQLVELGHDVTVIAEASWRERFERALGDAMPECVFAPPAGRVALAGLRGMRQARRLRRRYDVLVLGNPGKGMIPAAYYAAARGLAQRTLLFAHRVPTSAVLRALRPIRLDVLANSEWVGSYFKGRVSGDVRAYYGLANAEEFSPPGGQREDDKPIDFVLLGKLPHAIKGMDLAIEAYGRLPKDVRQRCRLNLASFVDPPSFDEEGIVAHPWMPPERIPEFLRTMDVMLCLSSIETFSQAIVQGMLTELPIIATPLPVYVEKVDEASGGAGGIIAQNPEEVARAMAALAQDREMRETLGAKGRTVALDRYAWSTERFVRDYLFAFAESTT